MTLPSRVTKALSALRSHTGTLSHIELGDLGISRKTQDILLHRGYLIRLASGYRLTDKGRATSIELA